MRNKTLFNRVNLNSFVGKTCKCGNDLRRKDNSCVFCVKAKKSNDAWLNDALVIKRREFETQLEAKKLNDDFGYGDL